MAGAGKHLDAQNRVVVPAGMARGGAEQADAVGDRDQFVGTAEDRQVRAAQAQCVGDGIVILLAWSRCPCQVAVSGYEVAGWLYGTSAVIIRVFRNEMVEWLGACTGPPPLRTRIAATLLQEYFCAAR